MITHEDKSEFTSVEPVCGYVDHVVMQLYSYVVTVAPLSAITAYGRTHQLMLGQDNADA